MRRACRGGKGVEGRRAVGSSRRCGGSVGWCVKLPGDISREAQSLLTPQRPLTSASGPVKFWEPRRRTGSIFLRGNEVGDVELRRLPAVARGGPQHLLVVGAEHRQHV